MPDHILRLGPANLGLECALRWDFSVSMPLQSSVSVEAPAAGITVAPPTITASRSVRFEFKGPDETAFFQCQLYGSTSADGNYTTCASPGYT